MQRDDFRLSITELVVRAEGVKARFKNCVLWKIKRLT